MKINDHYFRESIGTTCQLLKPIEDGGEWLCPCGKVTSIRSKDGHIIYSEKCGIEAGED